MFRELRQNLLGLFCQSRSTSLRLFQSQQRYKCCFSLFGIAAHRLASAAANFAAKEAFLKAAGTGLREPFSLCEIEAVRLESGAPAYHFSGQTAEWMQAHSLAARLSLSHEGGMALAFCTLETL